MYTINQNSRRREVYILLLSKVVLLAARSVMRWHSPTYYNFKRERKNNTKHYFKILIFNFIIIFLQYLNNYFYYLTFYLVIMYFDFFND